MLVGIDVSAAMAPRRTGVGHYVANLVGALQRDPANLDLLYFSNSPQPALGSDDLALLPGDIYPHHRLPSRLLWLQTGLSRGIAHTQPDICHFPNHLGPVLGNSRIPSVVTVHDMSVYRYPQHQPLKNVVVHRAFLPLLARRNSLIVTVSEAARQDILHYLRVPEERVRVVYEGVDPRFHPVRQSEDADILTEHRIDFPYVLSVGTLEPRKNQERLIAAFSTLILQERLPHHLVLVGPRGWKDQALRARLRQTGLADRIHLLGYVPTSHLAALYRGAAAFAFPSLYEGFGLPVVESMACGTPTLISTDPALMEVAGDAALAVDPYSADRIAAGLWQVLMGRSLTQRLRERGVVRARRFTWDRCAAETVGLYKEILRVPQALPQVSAAR